MASETEDWHQSTWIRVGGGVILVLAVISGLFLAVSMAPAGETAGAASEPTENTTEQSARQIAMESGPGVVSIKATNADGFSRGAGFIYSTDGNTVEIVTVGHVINGSERVFVQYSTGSWGQARVQGVDMNADVAVIEATGAPASAESLDLASEEPEQGETAVAIGNPTDLSNSVTAGIVAGTDRILERETGFVIPDVIQVDLPMASGNSGGPVFGPRGEVIGIVAAEREDGIGFVHSVAHLQRVLDDLRNGSAPEYASLGLTLRSNDPVLAGASNISQERGAVVIDTSSIRPDREFQSGRQTVETQEGILIDGGGDVIIEINQTEILTREDAYSFLFHEARPGVPVEVTVIRNGSGQTVSVTPIAWSEE